MNQIKLALRNDTSKSKRKNRYEQKYVNPSGYFGRKCSMISICMRLLLCKILKEVQDKIFGKVGIIINRFNLCYCSQNY